MGGAFTGKSTTLSAPITKDNRAILVFYAIYGSTGKHGISFAHVVKYRSAQGFRNNLEVSLLLQQYRKCLMVQKESARDRNCLGQVSNNLQFKGDKCGIIIGGFNSIVLNTVTILDGSKVI